MGSPRFQVKLWTRFWRAFLACAGGGVLAGVFALTQSGGGGFLPWPPFLSVVISCLEGGFQMGDPGQELLQRQDMEL